MRAIATVISLALLGVAAALVLCSCTIDRFLVMSESNYYPAPRPTP